MDLISRQAAIDAVRELYIQSPKTNNDIVYDMAIDQAHDALVNLPSAETERKKGKWIRSGEGSYQLYECSLCGKPWLHWWASAMDSERMNKEIKCCPNCGAEMEDEKNGR